MTIIRRILDIVSTIIMVGLFVGAVIVIVGGAMHPHRMAKPPGDWVMAPNGRMGIPPK